MVRAELNKKMDDITAEMHGDLRAVFVEVAHLVRMVGDQLEKMTGISSRTHIVNMCKMIVDDHMNELQAMDLAMKTMAGKEVSLEKLAEEVENCGLKVVCDLLQAWLMSGEMVAQVTGRDIPEWGKDARKLESLSLNLLNQALDIYNKH